PGRQADGGGPAGQRPALRGREPLLRRRRGRRAGGVPRPPPRVPEARGRRLRGQRPLGVEPGARGARGDRRPDQGRPGRERPGAARRGRAGSPRAPVGRSREGRTPSAEEGVPGRRAAPVWGSESGPHLEIAFEARRPLVTVAAEAVAPAWRSARRANRPATRVRRRHGRPLASARAARAGPRSNTGTESTQSGVRYRAARRLLVGAYAPISSRAWRIRRSTVTAVLRGALMPWWPRRLPRGCAPS